MNSHGNTNSLTKVGYKWRHNTSRSYTTPSPSNHLLEFLVLVLLAVLMPPLLIYQILAASINFLF